MDKTLQELVSRYVDGDLDDLEACRLEERAETDPELAAEIETTRELRGTIQALAGRMEPPAALDSVMEPLRQGSPVPAPRARPVFRWLGIAAAVVLGVAVATEMARRNPSPTLSRPSPQRERPVAEREEIFKLAPLPTAVPDPNRPLGAADHLLQEDPAPPAAPEPVPLEVIGPLETAAPTGVATESDPAMDLRDTDYDEEIASPQHIAPESESAKARDFSPAEGPDEVSAAPAPKRDRATVGGGRASRAGMSTTGKEIRSPAADRQKGTVVSAFLRLDETVVWEGFSSQCGNGAWPVEIEIRGGVVIAVEPLPAGGEDEAAILCQPGSLVGTHLDGIADGVHVGELLIGPRSE